MAATTAELADGVSSAHAAGAGMIELRFDALRAWTPDTVRGLMARVRPFPGEIIATCRIVAEGGQYAGDECRRIELLTLAAEGGADYVDVEHAAWCANPAWPDAVLPLRERLQGRGAPASRLKLILSKHDFERTPADLDALFAELSASPADVLKLACKAESITDSLRMLDALRMARRAAESGPAGRGVIALSMGETGILTRVLARKFGALLTFAALEAGQESAPGQPTLRELRELYRWASIHDGTKVYGVVGCPVAHSMSPAIHNAAFAELGHDGVYLPLRIEPPYEAFAAFAEGCISRPWLDLCGLSVTIPHKENLLRFVEAKRGEIEPLTRRIGVANTLHIEPHSAADLSPGGSVKDRAAEASPALFASNTDYRGALDALCAGTGRTPAGLSGMPVAVLGAGGAARAIVAGLCDCGCSVTVYNRTHEKAVELAGEFGAAALPWDQRVRPGTRIVVNCTSLGMWPKIGDTPLAMQPLAAEGEPLVVFDTVYNPIETRLLREAFEAGHETIDGVAMFVGQAAAQFERWTGRAAPTALMRDIVVERLRGR